MDLYELYPAMFLAMPSPLVPCDATKHEFFSAGKMNGEKTYGGLKGTVQESKVVDTNEQLDVMYNHQTSG